MCELVCKFAYIINLREKFSKKIGRCVVYLSCRVIDVYLNITRQNAHQTTKPPANLTPGACGGGGAWRRAAGPWRRTRRLFSRTPTEPFHRFTRSLAHSCRAARPKMCRRKNRIEFTVSWLDAKRGRRFFGWATVTSDVRPACRTSPCAFRNDKESRGSTDEHTVVMQ